MGPLLQFDRVRLEAPEGTLDRAAVEQARRVLAPGGRLELFEILQPRLRRDSRWEQLVARIEAAEQRLEAFALDLELDVTTDVDFEADAEIEPVPGAVLLAAGDKDLARWARIDRMITQGWPVLLPGERPPSRLAIALFDDPADVALRLAALRPLLAPGVRPTLMTPTRGRPAPALSNAEVADLLGVDAVAQRRFVRMGGSGAPPIRDLLDGDPLVLLPLHPSLSLGSTLSALGLLSATQHTVLVLPTPEAGSTARWDVSDLVRIDGRLVGAVERPTALGLPERPDGQRLIPIVDGVEQAPIPVVRGQFEAPEQGVMHLGLATSEGMRAVAATVEITEPTELVFLGAEPVRLRATALRRVGVRLDVSQPLARLHREVARLGLDGLLDAGAILRDGSPTDLPQEAADARARRVTARLVAAGLPIVGSWLHGTFDAAPGGDRLAVLTGAQATTATRIALLWDNRAARQRRLELFDEARSTIDVQTYQVLDDSAAREIELALARAAWRGVRVRVLADAVWSARGTADGVSPPLARLAEAPGLEVRLVRPFEGLPGIDDLKRRDHRKVLVVDGDVAILGGRNLGEPYLRGFDEVPVWRTTRSTDVPWLDLDVEVEGDVVDAVGATFEQAWAGAQRVGEVGEAPTPEVGPRSRRQGVAVRLVNHLGLRDAQTLDLYRDLIDGARERLTVVNTFPLQFELVTALGRALERGVELRILVGNVRPLFGERQPFAGGGVRDLANVVIHGRLDELVRAGAAVHEYALPVRPGWDPTLGRVLPHVHAKCLSADGQRFTVGSANLDITAAYWESEVVLLVEDEGETARLDLQLDELFAGSPRVEPDDPRWQQRARSRAWIAKNWPAALG